MTGGLPRQSVDWLAMTAIPLPKYRKDVLHMIKVDISNVWGQIALPDLLAMEKEVGAAHAKLMDGTG